MTSVIRAASTFAVRRLTGDEPDPLGAYANGRAGFYFGLCTRNRQIQSLGDGGYSRGPIRGGRPYGLKDIGAPHELGDIPAIGRIVDFIRRSLLDDLASSHDNDAIGLSIASI